MPDTNQQKAGGTKLQTAVHAGPYSSMTKKPKAGTSGTKDSKRSKRRKSVKSGQKSDRAVPTVVSEVSGVLEDNSSSHYSLSSNYGDRYQACDDDSVFALIKYDELKFVQEQSSVPIPGTNAMTPDTISGHALLNGMSNKVFNNSLNAREHSLSSISGRTTEVLEITDENGVPKTHVPVVTVKRASSTRRSSGGSVLPNLQDLESLYQKALGSGPGEQEEDAQAPSDHAAPGPRRFTVTATPANRRSSLAGPDRRFSMGGNRRLSVAGRRGSLLEGAARSPGGGRRASLVDGGAPVSPGRRGSLLEGAGGRRGSLIQQGLTSANRRISLSGAGGRRSSLLPDSGGIGFTGLGSAAGTTDGEVLSRRSSILTRSTIAASLSGFHLKEEEEEEEREDDKEEEAASDDVEESTSKGKGLAGKTIFPPQKKNLTIKQLVNIKKWQTRASGPKDPQNLKDFANDELHYTLLRQNMENVVTEIPLPLKITMFAVALAIIKDTVKDYESSLGKSHLLAREAREHLEELESLGELLGNM